MSIQKLVHTNLLFHEVSVDEVRHESIVLWKRNILSPCMSFICFAKWMIPENDHDSGNIAILTCVGVRLSENIQARFFVMQSGFPLTVQRVGWFQDHRIRNSCNRNRKPHVIG